MPQISEDAAQALAKGLAGQIFPTLVVLDERLAKFASQQHDLLKQLQQASDSSLTEPDLSNMRETMQKITAYRDKLLYITATMKSLDTRSRQLKEKAAQLHKARVNYDAQAAIAKQRNQEHDMAVAAKIVVPPTNALGPSISTTSGSPAHDSSSSSPLAESSQVTIPTASTTPQTEDVALTDSASVSSQTAIKKKKKAKPKRREVIIDDGPIKRPFPTPDHSRSMRPSQ